MSKRLLRAVAVALMAAVLLAVPFAGGCGGGGGDAGTRDLVIGFLADQTGPSANTYQALIKGIEDSLRNIQDTDPLPGARIKIVSYDTRVMYDRVPIGYEWLKGQGMIQLWHYVPEYMSMTAQDQAKDQIPCFSFSSNPGEADTEWLYAMTPDYRDEAGAAMLYLLQDWDWDARPDGPVVGYVGMTGRPSNVYHREGFEDAMSVYGKSVEVKTQIAAVSNTAWAGEIAALQDCDMIFMNTMGPGSASLINEGRQKGYDGPFWAFSSALMGFWSLVMNTVSMDYLHDIWGVQVHMLWSDDSPIIAEAEELLTQYRPSEKEALMSDPVYLSGYFSMLYFIDVLKRAVEDVGAENVDGVVLDEKWQTIDVSVPGFAEAFKCWEGHHVLHRPYRMAEFNQSAQQWETASDWFYPPGKVE